MPSRYCFYQDLFIFLGLDITEIENLGATRNKIDALDLSNNNIGILENIPYLDRLNTLLVSSNKISSIDNDLSVKLPNLKSLMMANNRIEYGVLEN